MKITPTNQLLKVIVDSIDTTFVGTSVTEESTGVYIIESCNTLWLTQNRTITIGGNDYVITDFSVNEWIKITGDVIPSILTFVIYSPFFWYGKVLAQDEQLRLIADSANKFPMIWLHEITSESFSTDELSIIDRESTCDLYFMVDADFTNWLTPQHYLYSIQPMRNLIDAFITALKLAPNVQDIIDFTILDHAKFGTYLESKGAVKNIFMDKISGSQLKINIPFLSTNECESCDNIIVNNCDLLLKSLTADERDTCILPTYDFTNPEVFSNLTSQQIADLTALLGGGDTENMKKIFTAGQNISGQKVVMISNVDDTIVYFDPTNIANIDLQLGMSDNAGLITEDISVIFAGIITNPGWDLTIDGVYYAAANGDITLTPPTSGISLKVGVAIDSDTLLINFSESIIIT